MTLYDVAKADVERITSGPEWGADITFAVPGSGGGVFDMTFDQTFRNAVITAQVKGIHVKHHLSFDSETGKSVNGKRAHVSVSEKFLVDAGYPVRNSKLQVEMEDHLVKVIDSTGVLFTYVIRETFADERVGLIVCILGDFKSKLA